MTTLPLDPPTDPEPASPAMPRVPRAWRRWLLAGFVVAVTAWPPLATLAREGPEGAFRHFADDAYYYLSVADHSKDRDFFTFDGVHPTNGFHPLWQLFLERGFALLELDAAGQLLFAWLASVAFVALGTAMLAWVLYGLTRRAWLALPCAVPGAFALLTPPIDPLQFTPWAFANGMESPLSIFLFGLLLIALFDRGWLTAPIRTARLFALSTLATLVVLTRLDDVFLFAPLLLAGALLPGTRSEALRRLAVLATPPLLGIGGYLAYNALVVGSLLPSSGVAKAEPSTALLRNGYALWTTLFPFADVLGRATSTWGKEAWRVLQMVLPAAAAVAWLWLRRDRLRPGTHPDPTTLPLAVLAGYVVLKAAYNFAVVGLWHQGHWYFPLSIEVFGLIVAIAVAHRLDARAAVQDAGPDGGPRRRLAALAPAAVACALALVHAGAFAALAPSPRQERFRTFFAERAEVVREARRACPGCGVLAFEDGILSWGLDGIPVLNAFGLVMDGEALDALSRGRLLELAWQRGHWLIGSIAHGMPDTAKFDRDEVSALLGSYHALSGQDLRGWEFETAFVAPSTGRVFLRFHPRGITWEDALRDRRAQLRRHRSQR